MAINAKAPQALAALVVARDEKTSNETVRPLEPKLQRVKESVLKNDYQRALELLPTDSQDPEIRNCRAVCLMRLQRFDAAVDVLRKTVIHGGLLSVRLDTPNHIKVNFATALFYSGHPAGALDILNEIRREDDPGVQRLRQATVDWVAQMSFIRRLDWKLNRIAPKKLPAVTDQPLGQFLWDVV